MLIFPSHLFALSIFFYSHSNQYVMYLTYSSSNSNKNSMMLLELIHLMIFYDFSILSYCFILSFIHIFCGSSIVNISQTLIILYVLLESILLLIFIKIIFIDSYISVNDSLTFYSIYEVSSISSDSHLNFFILIYFLFWLPILNLFFVKLRHMVITFLKYPFF